MGNSRFARCLQGGGVYVKGGTVAISLCTISGNTAYVRAHVQKVHIAPMGKLLTCLPRLTRLHNCERFGQLQYVRATETLKTSHRPMGNSQLLVVCRAVVSILILAVSR